MVENVAAGKVVVLAPSRWMRSSDVLPRSWDVTSDSVAAFVAGALDAARLVLIKPGTSLSCAGGLLLHIRAAHAACRTRAIGCDRLEELAPALSG